MKRWIAALTIGLASVAASGCGLEARKATVFITRDGRIVAGRAVDGPGEVILRITNNDDVRHRPLLLRLDPGQDPAALPRKADGTVDVGPPSDLEHRGPGYRVVEKPDALRPFFGSGRRVETIVHTYLTPGPHVLLDNQPGTGRLTEPLVFEVPER